MGKKDSAVDEDGNPYDYLVVIDAGSKGSRAYLYRAKQFVPGASIKQTAIPSDHKDNHNNDSDSDSDSEDEEKGSKTKGKKKKTKGKNKDTEKHKRDFKAKVDSADGKVYPQIETIYRKKVKPGIATFTGNPKKLGKKYIGKLLKAMEEHIPKSEISRTPVFLHATGGMRLLKPEDQSAILGEICQYIQQKFDFFLPDCASHINAISGETEGLYTWIGLNYKYSAFDSKDLTDETYGGIDMGGASSQIAFQPKNFQNHTEFLHQLNLNYLDPSDVSKFQYNVFSESFFGGINQAHEKYDEKLIAKNDLVDPCLPQDYIKTVTTSDGMKIDVKGSSNYKECLIALYDVLEEISVDKYCNQSDSTSLTSCLLSDEMPRMEFDVKKFIGINEIYSNLKEFVSYKQGYERAEKMCSLSYADLLKTMDSSMESSTDFEKTSDVCFKSAWIIDVLHQGLGFPRYGIDEASEDTSSSLTESDFAILDGFSWTMGRAVLYTFYETALRLNGNNTDLPQIGYYEPASQQFTYGGEVPGISMRPEYVMDYYTNGDDDKHSSGGHDSDDDDDDDDDWDDVLDEHRWWGSLTFLLILLIIVYLLLGKTKRQSIKDAVKRMVHERFRSQAYVPVEPEDDLELGEHELNEGEENNEGELSTSSTRKRSDSFEVE